MLTEPVVVQRADQPYVAIRALVTMDTLGAAVPPLNREVFGWLAARGAAASGAPFWKYNVIDMERQLEVEAGAPVALSIPGDDRVLAGVIPGGKYATVPRLEIYETDPAQEPDMDKWVTELAFRLAG